MGRHKNTTVFEQRLLRLRYDAAVRQHANLLIKKPTNWNINSPRDGVSDLIAKELAGADPPPWYTLRIAAKTNAVWRICVKDRAALDAELLRAARADDLEHVRRWIGEALGKQPEAVQSMVQYLGMDYEELYANGPLGGVPPADTKTTGKRQQAIVSDTLMTSSTLCDGE